MRYALMVYTDQSQWDQMSEDEAAAARAESMPAWLACFEAMRNVDPKLEGIELEEAVKAKTVRMRDGKALITDGPFADTKEQIGGVFLIDCPDLDVAVELAGTVPAARYGSLEIRPIIER